MMLFRPSIEIALASPPQPRRHRPEVDAERDQQHAGHDQERVHHRAVGFDRFRETFCFQSAEMRAFDSAYRSKLWRKTYRRGRYASSSAFRPAARPTSSRA